MALMNATLPTLYEYYAGNNITAGLSDSQPYFTLNNKNITIYSGSFHYYRVPRAYWRDRLRKMRAAGLNTVATCVPWNLHEPESGVYDFGHGGSEYEDFLHIEEFLNTAKEEDLFALIRTGPYINAEWEFGGLPSWIMRNVSSIRNSKDNNFLFYAKRYLNVLLPILALLQFQKGGPIVGFQIENEYGNTQRHDLPYLESLRQSFLDNGIKELLFTSDRPRMNGTGTIPGVLQMANFGSDAKEQLDKLNTLQENKPTMTIEYWTGWYQHWLDNYHRNLTIDRFRQTLKEILDYPSSINFYMFVGSTSFGFLNGATLGRTNNSALKPIINSYDYEAPLTEAGHYTEKYRIIKEMIAARNQISTRIPVAPEVKPLVAYESLKPTGQLVLADVINGFPIQLKSKDISSLENLPINNNSGQRFGYIVYRKTQLNLTAKSILKISGYVADTILVLINGKLISKAPQNETDINGFGFWRLLNSTIELTSLDLVNATLDLVVQNLGRSCQGSLIPKGLSSPVFINDNKISDWIIMPFEFKKSWTNSLNNWHEVVSTTSTPAFYKFVLTLDKEPQDSYLDMRQWNSGIAIVNGIVLSRYLFLGPQLSAYLPAPFLKMGENHIIIFEHFNAPNTLTFSDVPLFNWNVTLY